MKSLALYRNVYLTRAQKELYLLICDKINNDERLSFQEARKIYLNSAHRYFKEEKPARYDYWVPIEGQLGKFTCKLVLMTDEEIQWATTQWLMQNIGRLVLKGYLNVLPTIEMKYIQESSKND